MPAWQVDVEDDARREELLSRRLGVRKKEVSAVRYDEWGDEI